MKKLIPYVVFAVLFVFTSQAFALLSESLKEKIDNATQKSSDLTVEIETLVSNVYNFEDVGLEQTTVTQRDGKKALKKLKKGIKAINKVRKIVRKRLNKLRQNPNFNETEGEIEALELELLNLDDESFILRDVLKDLKNARKDMIFNSTLTQKALLEAKEIEGDFNFNIFTIDEIIQSGATCDDLENEEEYRSLLKRSNSLKKLIRKRLRKLFQQLDSSPEIRALQKALNIAKSSAKKYGKVVKEIAKVDKDLCNTVEIQLQAALGVECSFSGSIQPSGFATATFSCVFPQVFNRGLIFASFLHPDTGDFIDIGFATRSFSGPEDTRKISINPCPGLLPVCEEAAIIVRAVKERSAFLAIDGVYNGGTDYEDNLTFSTRTD